MITGKVTRFAYKKSGFSSGWGTAALLSKVAPSLGAAASVAELSGPQNPGRDISTLAPPARSLASVRLCRTAWALGSPSSQVTWARV